jgi:hypothetical protein
VVASSFHFLQSHSPAREGSNCLRWRLKKSEVFDTRSYYSALRGSQAVMFPWKGIWGVKAPRWVSFFCLDCCLG